MKYVSAARLASAVIALVTISGLTGCTRVAVVAPRAVELNSPPILVEAERLYKDYIDDEAAAGAAYEGQKVWVTNVRVNDCRQSSDGKEYLILKWHLDIIWNEQLWNGENWFVSENYAACTLILQSDKMADYSDATNGYLVEATGLCRGLSKQLLTVKSSLEASSKRLYLERPSMYSDAGGRDQVLEKVVILEVSRLSKTGLPPPPGAFAAW